MLLTTPRQPFPSPLPLVLDLDGTMIHTDTFHEMMAHLLIHNPLILLRLPFWFLKGRPYAKAQLVAYTDLNLENLPYNRALLCFAQQAKQEGRPLILATGTDQRLAEKISEYLGIFQKVIGSNEKINMTGRQKSYALVDHFGINGFDYAGDSPIDEWVWKVSHKAIVVCPKWGVLKKARSLKKPENIHYLPRERARWMAFIGALRPLFWICNLISSSLSMLVGLSLLTSGLLILGDILSLEKERQGRGKRKSMFAEGHLHLVTAFITAPLLILSSLLLLFSSPKMIFCILGYIPVFMGIDQFTRHLPHHVRWALLGLFQLFAILLMNLSQ